MSRPVSHTTAARDRVPPGQNLAYATSWITHSICWGLTTSLVYPIFNVELGVSAATIGIILALTRLWDAVTDPLMGNISDNYRSRWGRRRPFVLFGAAGLALTLPAIYAVPAGLSESARVVWLGVTLILALTAYTVWVVPLLALGFEMSPDSRERTRVQAWRAYGMGVGGVVAPWIYWLAQRPVFSDPAHGAKWVCLALAPIIFVVGALPAWCNRERFQKVASKQARISVLAAFRETMRNRPFLVLIGLTFTFLFGSQIVNALGFYVVLYHMVGGDKLVAAKLAGIGGTILVVGKFVFIPLTSWVATRFGKKPATAMCLWALLFGALSKWVTFNPQWPYLHLFTSNLLIGFSAAGFWVVVSAMKADLCDEDELNTGRRREGMYGAVSGWFQKLAVVIASAASGVLVTLSGVNPDLGVAQSPETLLLLRVFFFAPTAIFAIIALWLLRFYTLDEERLETIRAELERRRGGTETA